jgi:1,2-diacylglycerol 3-beta-galactosyltransferase
LTHPSPHLVFLFSDTGGGHRSAALAIIGALEQRCSGQYSCEMVDIFREISPRFIDQIPDIYPWLAAHPRLLGQIFRRSDHPRTIDLILKTIWPYIRPGLNRLIREHPADLYVSVHPLINIPLGHAFFKAGIHRPWITVVTDLVTAHTTWFCAQADRIVVPTPEAFKIGRKWGIPEEQMQVIGQPVSVEFNRDPGDPQEIRSRLGWPIDRPVVLLMGGGEGVGKLEDLAREIDAAGLPVTLVVVAGRNQELKQRLESQRWSIPVRIYGFVQSIPDFMRASTILLSKAGPGTLSEAACAGLPVIIYSKLDGPEDGNVLYFVERGMGTWAPRNEQAIQSLKQWLDQPAELAKARSACLEHARPQAALDIAELIMAQLLKSKEDKG